MDCETEREALIKHNESLKKTIKDTSDDLNDVMTVHSRPPPTFWISLLFLVVVVVVTLLTYIFETIISKQVMTTLNEYGILEAIVKAYRTNDSMVDIEGQRQKFEFFWGDAMTTISKMIMRGRFFLSTALFVAFLGIILITYSLIYRGENYQLAARMISIAMGSVLMFTFLFTNNHTMIEPFENVIGYSVILLTMGQYLTQVLKSVFRHKYFTNKQVFPGADLYYNFIINTMNVDNYPVVLEEIHKNGHRYDFELNMDERTGINGDVFKTLFQIVMRKNTIGHACWLTFGCFIGSLISFKYVLQNL